MVENQLHNKHMEKLQITKIQNGFIVAYLGVNLDDPNPATNRKEVGMFFPTMKDVCDFLMKSEES